jgi:hypothetical protein
MVTADTWPRPAINFDTPNVVLVVYPWGAGGKFLINSLGVASNACLQNMPLTQRQLRGHATSDNKKQFIRDVLAGVTDRWNDLKMGSTTMLGVDEGLYVTEDPATAQYWPWYNGVSELTYSNQKFFIDVHDAAHLAGLLRVWHNAQIVVFENCQAFLKQRRVNYSRQELQSYWRDIQDAEWASVAPETWDEFCALPTEVQHELSTTFNSEIFRFIQHPVATQSLERHRRQQLNAVLNTYKNAPMWLDGNMYLDWKLTKPVIQRCYELFELENIDIEFIEHYYRTWTKLILEVPI